MQSLYDTLRGAQGGRAIDNIGREYGLTPEQTEAALQALLPAFAEGLQRSAASPDGLRSLLGMIAGQEGTRAYDDPLAAADESGRQTGNAALATLFGSKDVSRAVAQQAASFSGIGPEILKRMLPTIANVVIGGLIRNMMRGRGGGSSGGGLGDILGSVLGGGTRPQQTPSGRAGRPARADRADRRETRVPRARTGESRRPPAGDLPRDDDGSGGFLDDVFSEKGTTTVPSGGRGRQQNSLEDIFGPATPGVGGPGPDSAAPRPGGGSLMDVLGDLFRPGRDIPEGNRRGMESIFDGFFGPKPR